MQYRERHHRTILFLGVFWAVYGLIQMLWVSNFAAWMSGYLSLCLNVFLILVCWYLFRGTDSINLFLRMAIGAWAVFVLFGTYEMLTGFHWTEPLSIWSRDNLRLFFANPNDCGTWLVLCYCFVLFYQAVRRSHIVWFVLAWIPTFVLVLETGSRACLIGIVLLPVLYAASKLFIHMTNNSKQALRMLLATGSIAVTALALIFALYLTVGDAVGLLDFITQDASNAQSNLTRVELIIQSFELITDYAMMGCGAGQSVQYLGTNAHNLFLELFIEYGFVIGGIFVYMLVSIFARFFHRRIPAGERAFCFSFTCSFIIISISSSSINRLRIMWVLLVLVFLYHKAEWEPRRYTVVQRSTLKPLY